MGIPETSCTFSNNLHNFRVVLSIFFPVFSRWWQLKWHFGNFYPGYLGKWSNLTIFQIGFNCTIPFSFVLYWKAVLRCFNKFTSFQHQLHMDWTWLHKFLGSEVTSRTAMVMVMGSEKTPVRTGCGELFSEMTRSNEFSWFWLKWLVCLFFEIRMNSPALFQLIFLRKMLLLNLENPREPKFFLRVPPSMDTSRHHLPHCDDSRCSRFNMAEPYHHWEIFSKLTFY